MCDKYFTNNYMRENNYLTEVYDEDWVIRKLERDRIILLFYKRDYEKCQILSKALKFASLEFNDIEFLQINVDSCEKMCDSLNINVLPFVGFFRDGMFVDKIIGFENIGEYSVDNQKLIDYIRNSYIYRKE